MSKMDDLRAMREARFEARPGVARATPAPRATAARPVTKRPAASRTTAEKSPATESLCGHRAISGRTCTREQGHAEKSHRYS